jgi:hypothetical protein
MFKNHVTKGVAAIFVIVVGVGLGLAQGKNSANSWESKPVDQWTDSDLRDIFHRSAWSHPLESRMADKMAGEIVRTVDDNRVDAYFSLESALTIRLAEVRKLQLAEKYDKMTAKEQAAFNEKHRGVLICPLCQDYYIVGIIGDNSTLKNRIEIQRRAQSIYLSNEKGERRILAKYTPQILPNSAALFFFPRLNEKGEPLLTSDNTTLTFNFKYEIGDAPFLSLIERVDTNVKDIVRDKTVIF